MINIINKNETNANRTTIISESFSASAKRSLRTVHR